MCIRDSTQGVVIDENSIFDIQVKRLHEYLSLIHILCKAWNGCTYSSKINLINTDKMKGSAPRLAVAEPFVYGKKNRTYNDNK